MNSLFDRKTGGVSHSAVCVLGVVMCQELSLIVTVLWDPKPKPFGTRDRQSRGVPGQQLQRSVHLARVKALSGQYSGAQAEAALHEDGARDLRAQGCLIRLQPG